MAVHFMYIDGYPAICKNSAWQKQKSFMDKAKSKTKTGLGDTLVAAEKAWGQVKFEWLDAGMARDDPSGKWRSEEHIAEKKARAKIHLDTKVKIAARALEVAASKARVTGDNAALSTKARTAAKAISAELLKQAANLKGIKLDDFDAAVVNFRRVIALPATTFKPKVLALETKLNDVARTPTVAEWNRLDLKNAFRSVANTLGNDPQYKDIWPTWKPWDGLQVEKNPKLHGTPSVEVQSQEILEIVNKVRPELNKLKVRVGV